MKRFTALIAVAFLGGNAAAADLGGMKDSPAYEVHTSSTSSSWSGFYLGGHVGYGWYGHDGEFTYGEYTETGSGDTDGLFGGLRLGADYQPSGSRVVFGLFGDYDFTSAKIDGVEEGNSWLIAGRVGIVPNERLLVYGLAGLGGSDVDYTIYGYKPDASFTHVVVGAGAEYKFTKNVSGYIEYQHALSDKETIYQYGNLKITDDRDADKVMVGINYRFGFND